MRIAYENPALGVGGFGRVYRARIVSDWEGSRAIALKKIRNSDYVEYPGLLHEACGLVLASDHPAIPQVFGWGRSQFFEYLAIELLGYDISRRLSSETLTRRNFVSLVLQMFAAVKHVHDCGILHCDIKPNNFVFGVGEHAGWIYLLDFNLWTAWRTFDTHEHLEADTAAAGFRGTYCFASINCHLDGALSRRDDFESLAYSIFMLYAGGLPWYGEKDSIKVLHMKQIWQGSRALQGTCEYPLGHLVYYAQDLGFPEEPDYEGWREAFWRVDNAAIDFPNSDPPYDPADTTEAVPGNMDFLDWTSPVGNTYNVSCRDEPNMGRMEVAPGSDHGFQADSSRWGRPLTMKPEDTMDGSQDLIRDFIQHISQPPTTSSPSLRDSCAPEVMRGFDDPIPFKQLNVKVTDKEEAKEEPGQESLGKTVEEAKMEGEAGGKREITEEQTVPKEAKEKVTEEENKEDVNSGRRE